MPTEVEIYKNLTISAEDIADKTITAAKIADKTITAAKIADKTITAAQIADKTITAAQIADETILQLRGSILQVIHTELKTSFAQASVLVSGVGYYIDVTGLSGTITPTSTTSKILILTNMYIGSTSINGGYQQHFRIKRNGTAVILGAGEDGRPTSTGGINMYDVTGASTYHMSQLSGVHYDSPSSTSALTYQIALGGYSGSPIVYVNRSETWQNSTNNYDSTPVSTLTLMEVSA